MDERDNLKLNLSGGTMSGDINMGNHHIIHATNYTPSSDQHVVNKKYMIPNTVANIYTLQMDDEGIFDVKDDTSSVEYEGSTKKINKFLNLSRNNDWFFKQDDSNKKPLFKKSTINNNFYCVQYLGSNTNNLHLSTLQDILSNQYLNFYFVYGLKSLKNEVSLFKITPDETSNHILAFDYGVSYNHSSLYITNSSPISVPNSYWELKANATQINKLIYLSIHWNQNNTNNPKEGNLYVNGKEIFSFRTSDTKSHISTMKLYLGSTNKDHGQIDGEILYVYVSTRKMKYPEIVLNHYLLCEKYNIDFDKDEILEFMYK